MSTLRSSQDTQPSRGWSHWSGVRRMLETSSDTLWPSSLPSNSHTLGRVDELFTVLRLFFAITVGYTFNCERRFVVDTRRTEVGRLWECTAASTSLVSTMRHSFQSPLQQRFLERENFEFVQSFTRTCTTTSTCSLAPKSSNSLLSVTPCNF